MANPIITITMENGDVMKAELYPEIAPNTVNNFISLVKKRILRWSHFPSCHSRFHDSGWLPGGGGMGRRPGYSIKGEFAQNGFTNH